MIDGSSIIATVFAQHSPTMWWLFLGASGVIFRPAPSLHFSSPWNTITKNLYLTFMQELLKKDNTYYRENNGVINLMLHKY